jgi:hypothetical protein
MCAAPTRPEQDICSGTGGSPAGPRAGQLPVPLPATWPASLRGGGMLARGRPRADHQRLPSGVGFAPIPMVSAYVVSKTASYWLSENLAAERAGMA